MITQIEMQYMESVKKIARVMCAPKEIDWEQRRWELTCHIAQGLYAGNSFGQTVAPGVAPRLADEIIAAYKEQTSEKVKE